MYYNVHVENKQEVRETKIKHDWTKKQPNTIFIGDVEVPSYQNCWRERMELEKRMSKLRVSSIIQYTCIILLSIAVIILAQK